MLLRGKEITLEIALPAKVLAVHYVKNSHFIKLTDDKRREIKLWAKQILRGECPKCKFVFYTETPLQGGTCPRCQAAMQWAWGTEQLSFIPEEESDFLKD